MRFTISNPFTLTYSVFFRFIVSAGFVVKRGRLFRLRLSALLHQPFNSMNNTPGRALRQGAEPRRAHLTTASLSQPIKLSNSLLTLIILLTYNNSLISLFIFLNPIITLRCAVVKLCSDFALRCAPYARVTAV